MKKIGITHKLFLAILAPVIFAVVLVSTATQLSFTHSFLGYLNELADERMELLIVRAEEAYARHGNWDFLRGNSNVWFSMLRPSYHSELQRHFLPGSNIPPADLTGAFLRMGLIDAQQQWVAGFRDLTGQSQRRPVKVNGQTVGWVVLASFQSVVGTGNERFEREQLQVALLASLIAVALAGLIAWWLARTLLAPVKRVAGATHQLAAGQYDTRVAVASDDEVGRLASDFNHLAKTLQRNEHLRRDFMADVSHELRTPLAILRGELEAIDDGIRPLTPAALRSLQAEVATLSQRVDDLYALALSDTGALAYRAQPIDLSEPLKLAVEASQTRLAQHPLQLELQLPEQCLPVTADPVRLQQLFINLLENSLRYTDSGGRLRIVVEMRHGELQIDWQDSAPGVAAELLPRLFERFFRGDHSRRSATGGSGLGLAICRNIVEAHGGTIEAKASPLGGLWIAIGLPTP